MLHPLCQADPESVRIAGLRRKRTGLLLNVQTFLTKLNLEFYLEMNVNLEEEWSVRSVMSSSVVGPQCFF